jgi:hypothetical protein
MGKSSWVHSRTQGFVSQCYCRWTDVLRVLRQLSLSHYGRLLDHGLGQLLISPLLLSGWSMSWHSIETHVCVREFGFKLFASATLNLNWYCNNSTLVLRCFNYLWTYVSCDQWLLNLLRSRLCYWKVWNPSRFHGLPGLYGLKYARSTA